MVRKIELELSEEAYSKLVKTADEYGVPIEEYISRKAEEGLEDILFRKAMKQVIKELQDTIKKIEAIKYEGSDSKSKPNKILIYSYNSLLQSSNSLSQEILRKVEAYKQKGWFDHDRFYFIVCKSEIVGLFGLSLNEEPMPFGRYLFIYALYLEKSHQTKQNLSYLSGYIKAVAKQERTMNIDLCDAGTNISTEGLREMGFYDFSSAKYTMGYLGNAAINSAPSIRIEAISLTPSVLEKYLPAARVLPIKLLMEGWRHKELTIGYESHTIKLPEGDEITYLLIKETEKSSVLPHKNTVLVLPIDSFDKEKLENIYKNIFDAAKGENESALIKICIPIELEHMENHFFQVSTQKIDWYRKVLTSK